jgi:YggT family protein
MWIIIGSVILSWLLVFNVVNTRNIWVYRLQILMNRLTDPVYRQLRRFVPPIAGIDLTPMIVIFAIFFLQSMLISLARSGF